MSGGAAKPSGERTLFRGFAARFRGYAPCARDPKFKESVRACNSHSFTFCRPELLQDDALEKNLTQYSESVNYRM